MLDNFKEQLTSSLDKKTLDEHTQDNIEISQKSLKTLLILSFIVALVVFGAYSIFHDETSIETTKTQTTK